MISLKRREIEILKCENYHFNGKSAFKIRGTLSNFIIKLFEVSLHRINLKITKIRESKTFGNAFPSEREGKGRMRDTLVKK